MAIYENYKDLKPMTLKDLDNIQVGDKVVRIVLHAFTDIGSILTVDQFHHLDSTGHPVFRVAVEDSSMGFTLDGSYYDRYAKYPVSSEGDKFLMSLY